MSKEVKKNSNEEQLNDSKNIFLDAENQYSKHVAVTKVNGIKPKLYILFKILYSEAQIKRSGYLAIPPLSSHSRWNKSEGSIISLLF